MAIFNCNSIIRPRILTSSSPLPNNLPPSPPSPPHFKPKKHLTTNRPQQNLQTGNLKQKKVEQPSVLEIERAIGAGKFRDRDPNSGAEEKNNLFDNLVRNSIGENEGSVERKLRESGEWLIHQTENTSRSAGKGILMTMFQWILPMWILAFLLAAGIVQLPFNSPFLKDLLS